MILTKSKNMVLRRYPIPKKVCNHCGGRVESKGVRRETRRYRCSKCNKNCQSELLTESEIEILRKKDKGIGDLTLIARQKELQKLNNPVCLSKKPRKTVNYPCCLLPQYDPKWQNKIQLSVFEYRLNKGLNGWNDI